MSDWFAINEDLWGTVAGSRPPLFYFFDGFIDSGRVGATLIEAMPAPRLRRQTYLLPFEQ